VPAFVHRESEPARLQREADDYTKNVETSKKKLLRANDAQKNTRAEVHGVEDKIRQMIPSEEEVNRERVKRSQLINRVAHKKVLLNRTIGINTQLTHDINSMRREIMFANTAIATMKANIAECKAVSLAHHKVSQKQNQVSNEMNNQILSMKYLNETNTQKIRRQTQALETELNARIPKDEFE
jgi:predicted RecB family nuclease